MCMLNIVHQKQSRSAQSMHQRLCAVYAVPFPVVLAPWDGPAVCGGCLRAIASRCSRRGGRCSRGSRGCDCASVVRHVGLDEVACAEGAVEREFSCEDAGANDAGELARVVAGCFLVGAAHAEEVKHGGLRLEDCAAANGADFD